MTISAYPMSLSLALVALFSTAARADRSAEIRAQLESFAANPSQAMEALPPKFNPLTGERVQSTPRFTAEDIASREFVTHKDNQRKTMCKIVDGARVCLGDLLPGRAPWNENDQPEILADNGDNLVRSLKEMDKKKLKKAELEETPWSDNYWPIYSGQAAYRYADPEVPKTKGWKRSYNYSESNPFLEIFRSGDAKAIDLLSPAEKYDLLVGDHRGGLTASNWEAGEEYYSANNGKVETWMGLCHGWAPASYMVARPKHSIELVAADGETPLKFYPSDIKALATLLWAKGQSENRFAGIRCYEKKPERDSNGRIVDDNCFDTNPATWHLSVVNQIGVVGRSFVMDATYDYEVWNQPVYAYEYSYFNPQTRDETSSLNKATVEISEFTKDKFKKYRSPNTASVVGIAMDVTYVTETDPSHAEKDSHQDDEVKTVRYLYDLELDADGKVIGGEWYQNAHPDFLWTPPAGEGVLTGGDSAVRGHWRGTTPMPETWRKAAAATSRSEGAPLARVIRILSGLARE